MKRTPKNSKLFEYLLEKGLIGSTDSEAISKAKADYRKQYLLQAKRKQRQSKKSITIQFSTAEFETFESYAKQYGMKYPALIKQILKAYFAERSIVIQPQKIYEIHYAYYQIVELLQKINNKRSFSTFFSNELEDALKELSQFQHQIQIILENPHEKQTKL
jgi:hypothetical protein